MNARIIACAVAASALIATSLVGQSQPSAQSSAIPGDPGALMSTLAGTWHFELYQLGETRPVVTGQRQMSLLPDSTKLAWTETLDGREDTGAGIMGYNSVTQAYYLLAAYSHQPDPILLTGHRDQSGTGVSFDPVGLGGGLTMRSGVYVASELRLLDRDHFEWMASDGRWRAIFSRTARS